MPDIYLDNDYVVKLDGLKDDDGTAVTAATVEARVLDRDKEEVAGIAWPVTLSHTSNGNYEGTIDKALQLEDKALYYVEVTASHSGRDATWRVQHISRERE